MQDIPEILKGKIWEERFYPDIFDIHKDQRYAVQKFYQKGSITINGESQKCYFLTGTWNEYPSPNRPPVKAQAVTDGIDFSTVVIAKNNSEAREKILQIINNDYVSQAKKKYTLYKAYWQLQAKDRGSKQEPWKTEARRWALILYKWLRSEMIDNTKGTFYPDIEEELKKLGIKRGQWKSAKAVQNLTYHLVKREWPQLNVRFSTFEKHYLSHTEKSTILLFSDEVSWTAIANKFFHHGRSFLWFLNYEDKGERLVIQRPKEDRIFSREPLQASFEVYKVGKNWETMELTYKKDSESAYCSWWDSD